MKNYIVATVKPWNIEAFNKHAPNLPGNWSLITDKNELLSAVNKINPRYIFFPHWSWIVPTEILKHAECVCFHMTDVPFGRGGSPLQNLIVRGHKETKLSALRMVKELDAGPVYLKKPLSLEGRAQDIYERAADRVYDLIKEIVIKEPQPDPQEGKVTNFSRRTPDMSRLPNSKTSAELYDHIRMLDADTYCRAFLEHGDYTLSFYDADLESDGTLSAKVVFHINK